jgi:hypothetical protein
VNIELQVWLTGGWYERHSELSADLLADDTADGMNGWQNARQ